MWLLLVEHPADYLRCNRPHEARSCFTHILLYYGEASVVRCHISPQFQFKKCLLGYAAAMYACGRKVFVSIYCL